MENDLLLINEKSFISLSSSAAENFESLYVRNFVNSIWKKKKSKQQQQNTNTKKQRHEFFMCMSSP